MLIAFSADYTKYNKAKLTIDLLFFFINNARLLDTVKNGGIKHVAPKFEQRLW